MIGKLAVAGAMALALLPSFEAVPQATPVIDTYVHPYVKKVLCAESQGSAFMIEGGRFVSVHHVTDGENCKIDGKPITVIESDRMGDFSILTVPGAHGKGLKVNCGGFSHGKIYYALGYAHGLPMAVVLRADIFATLLYGKGVQAVLAGARMIIPGRPETVIPGQSGAPVIDEQGEARGTVNARNSKAGLSWSRPLSETSLCQS